MLCEQAARPDWGGPPARRGPEGMECGSGEAFSGTLGMCVQALAAGRPASECTGWEGRGTLRRHRHKTRFLLGRCVKRGDGGPGFPVDVLLLSFLIACLYGALGAASPAPAGGAGLDGLRPGPVYVLPVTGDIDLGLAAFVRRGVREAEEARAALLVVEINTFGGRVDAATEIRDALIRSPVPTAAYVEQRAWSAGALIALSAERIGMRPGSTIGAAEPIPAEEKTVSALRAEFESTAERFGRDPVVAGAMVDRNVERPGLVERGEILTLSAAAALEIGFVDAVETDLAAFLETVGAGGRPVVRMEMGSAEYVARLLSNPIVSQILLTVGMLGLIAEATSPGLGFPGIAGVTALALFFGARMIAGLVGMEALLLFLLSLILIGLEIFVLPGVGVVGAAGVIALFASLFMAFPDFPAALQSVGVSLLLSLAIVIILARYTARRGAWRRLVLETGRELAESAAPTELVHLEGKEGVASTPLRPAGGIVIDGEPYDAVTEGAYVNKGSRVRVVKVEGNRIVVRPLPPPGDDQAGGGPGGSMNVPGNERGESETSKENGGEPS